MYKATTAYKKIVPLKKRIKVIQGGTAAGKTIGILLKLIDIAQVRKYSISVVSESLPHLRRGALRDFLSIMQERDYYEEERYNRTEKIYSFETGATMEFFAVDEVGKVRGPRRDILFMNEANNVSYEIYDQLEVRTAKEIIIDYNPVSEFWAHTEVIPKVDHDFLVLTYLDNEYLNPQIKASIESRRNRENWWKVYGLGQIGVQEGLIYPNWEIVDDVSEHARLLGYGGDFGYTIDPTSITAIYFYDGKYILDEKIYRTGLTNPDIINATKLFDKGIYIWDSAEPKSIEELKMAGMNAEPATKGPGSVNHGIQLVQDLTIQITKRSVNIIKEQRNYMWKKDKDGKPMNIPEDFWNHSMDGVRYFLTFHKAVPVNTSSDFGVI